ncbi:IS66 family insertion sequence element accessory protein TnpB [Erysipelotrichaceae bacterium 51-3]
MLKNGTDFSKIILVCGRVDLRRGIDGLAAHVRLNYDLDPYEKGTLYLFCGRRAGRIKALAFEGIGMTLYIMRLSGDNRFQWPRKTNEAVEITREQHQNLMGGFPLTGTIKESHVSKSA